MNTKLLAFTALIIFLTACGSKTETYTADYLYNNDDVRATVLADCAANKQTQENCKAANDAEKKNKAEEYAKKAFQ